MAQRPRFEPDISIGQMLVLSKLDALTQDGEDKELIARLAKLTSSSVDRIHEVMDIIGTEFGAIEVPGTGSRKTRRLNERGKVIGATGDLIDLLTTISARRETDQTHLLNWVRDLTDILRIIDEANYFATQP